MSHYFALRVAVSLSTLVVAGAVQAASFTHCADGSQFEALSGSLCIQTQAPLDYAKPDAGIVELFVRRFPVAEDRTRRGEVWLVAGGPGETGASFYPALHTLRRAFPDYDLVIPDHRGTGYSTKICPVQESRESPAGLDLAGDEWGPCIGAMYGSAARTQAFTITHAARDLSGLIRTHRGEGAVYLYGVSYGTQLALRMLQVAPVELDGLILDGLVPPEGALQWEISRRTRIVDNVGRAFLTPNQTKTVEHLVAYAGDKPVWLDQVPGKDIRGFMGRLLNFPELRARIPDMADALLRDDTALLERTVDDLSALGRWLQSFPQSPPSMPLVMLITGSENNSRADLTRAQVTAEAEDALFTSPLPALAVEPPVPLYERDAAFGKLPARLPRTLVIQGTLDPATPIDGAQAHITALAPLGEVKLTTVVGGAHGLVLTAPDCFALAVSAFVSVAKVPDMCELQEAR